MGLFGPKQIDQGDLWRTVNVRYSTEFQRHEADAAEIIERGVTIIGWLANAGDSMAPEKRQWVHRTFEGRAEPLARAVRSGDGEAVQAEFDSWLAGVLGSMHEMIWQAVVEEVQQKYRLRGGDLSPAWPTSEDLYRSQGRQIKRLRSLATEGAWEAMIQTSVRGLNSSAMADEMRAAEGEGMPSMWHRA